MPPVFGPSSSSQAPLVVLGHRQADRPASVADGEERRLRPGQVLFDHHALPGVAEAPVPASPRAPARSAANRSGATVTPLPAARPSALTTTGKPNSAPATAARASLTLRQTRKRAVGTACRAMNALATPCSIRAGRRDGWARTDAGPRDSNRSCTPRASGSSGPTTVRSAASTSAQASTAAGSDTSSDPRRPRRARSPRCPARRSPRGPRLPTQFPGQGHARARPLPTTSTFHQIPHLSKSRPPVLTCRGRRPIMPVWPCRSRSYPPRDARASPSRGLHATRFRRGQGRPFDEDGRRSRGGDRQFWLRSRSRTASPSRARCGVSSARCSRKTSSRTSRSTRST